MTLYRKKPLEVEAEKWDGDRMNTAVSRLLQRNGIPAKAEDRPKVDRDTHELLITTVDGNRVKVPVGAYVVLDGKGFPYPCDAELFEAGHEPLPVP